MNNDTKLKRALFFISAITVLVFFTGLNSKKILHVSPDKDIVEKPLNIIIITADDLGLQLGCYGDTIAQTPNIDRLAEGCMRFENAFVTQSSCSPSRSSILTGLYPHQNGQIGLANRGYSMFEGITTLPSVLKRHGYHTGIIGKLHVNPENLFPFDSAEKGTENTRDVSNVAKQAETFFKTAGPKPFFLYINYFDPHHKFIKQVKNIPEVPYTSKTVRAFDFQGISSGTQLDSIAGYYNGIARVDAGIGMLMEKLSQAGLAESTLIIFVGDNGPPFARGKGSNYEAGLKVPLIVNWPGISQKKTTSTALVSCIDIMPSVLEAAGVSPIKTLPGNSLSSLLKNKDSKWRKTVCAEFTTHTHLNYYPRRSIRNERYKLIVNLLPDRDNPLIGVDGDSAYEYSRDTVFYKTAIRKAFDVLRHPPAEELYDLKTDPVEFHNLAGKPGFKNIQNELRTQLSAWRKETADPLLDKAKLTALTREHDKKMKNK